MTRLQAALALSMAAVPAMGQTIYIDPGAPVVGDGSESAPLNAWPGALIDGAAYLQKAGTRAPFMQVAASGVTLGAYGTGRAPVLEGVSFSASASRDVISGFRFEDAEVGVTMNGASEITVRGNIIEANAFFGISDQGGHSNTFSANVIRGNGGGGVELSNSPAGGDRVLFNLVSANGSEGPGYSGIHTFGGFVTAPPGHVAGPTGLGNRNRIACNVVTGTVSPSYDGNGIQIDDYTSGNLIEGNAVQGNAGAGLYELGGSNNRFSRNIAVHDGINQVPELLMGEQSGAPPMTGNLFVGNIVVPGFGVSEQQASSQGSMEGAVTGAAVPAAATQFVAAFRACGAPADVVAAMLAIVGPLETKP